MTKATILTDAAIPPPARDYLGRSEVAAHLGLPSIRTLDRMAALPRPDAWIGDRRGWLPETIDAWHAGQTIARRKPARYLGRTEVAEHLGMKSIRSLAKVELPPHDAEIDERKGWTVKTIDKWNASRPGRGRWGARTGQRRAGTAA